MICAAPQCRAFEAHEHVCEITADGALRSGCGHCFHVLGRQTLTDDDAGTMTESERCCHCGAYKLLYFRRQKDPTHGQHAPAVWILEASLTKMLSMHNYSFLADDGTVTSDIYKPTRTAP